MNLPGNLKYKVEEINIPDGYTLDSEEYDSVSESSDQTAALTPDENGYCIAQPNTWQYVTVTNKKLDTFSFTKIWRDTSCSTNIDWPDETEITVTICGTKNDESDIIYKYLIDNTNLTAENEINAYGDDSGKKQKLKVKAVDKSGYLFTLNGLPSGYTWSVFETPVENWQVPKYADENHPANGAEKIGDGGIIYNDQIGATLPSTGGHGTSICHMIGLSLIALAAIFAPAAKLGSDKRRK